MKVFVDSSGWIGVFNPRDNFHARSYDAMSLVNDRRITLVTTDYILDETITTLLRAINHRTAENFVLWVLRQPSIEVVHISDNLWKEALSFFRKYNDQEFAFTDCTSFVVMSQLKITQAFTFDHHFEQMGFNLWPQ